MGVLVLKNVDEEGELEERWYQQRQEVGSGSCINQLAGVQPEAWGRQD